MQQPRPEQKSVGFSIAAFLLIMANLALSGAIFFFSMLGIGLCTGQGCFTPEAKAWKDAFMLKAVIVACLPMIAIGIFAFFKDRDWSLFILGVPLIAAVIAIDFYW